MASSRSITEPKSIKKKNRMESLDVANNNLDQVSRETTMMSTRASKRGALRMSRQNTKVSLSRASTELSLNSQPTRTGKRKGNTSINVEELKKTMPKGWNIREGFQGLVYFRRLVRFVIVFMNWIKALREEAEKTGGAGSDVIAGLANQDFGSAMVTADGLTFELKDYQSKKEILLSSDVREILNQHPTLRTQEQVQSAKYGLQHVQSFSEYPLHMQEKLATVAYFQEVEQKRVIIREGHQAENFYFILSGSAIARKLIKDDSTNTAELRTEGFLSKGDSFGELELLHHSKRQVTVVSRTPMTLLCIGRDNFFEIFMSSKDESSLPEHIKFLSTLEVMKGFPMNTLVENPGKCLLHFFRRGSVIVEDSTDSEWLYFVKSGTCEVLKELKGVAHKQTVKMSERSIDRLSKRPVDDSLCLPKLGTGAQSSKTHSGMKLHAPPKPKTPREKLKKKEEEISEKKPNNFLEGDFLAKQDDHLPLLQMERKLSRDVKLRERYDEMISSLDVPIAKSIAHRKNSTSMEMTGFTRSQFKNLTVVKKRKPQPILSPPVYADPMRKPRVTFEENTDSEKLPEDTESLQLEDQSTKPEPDSTNADLKYPKVDTEKRKERTKKDNPTLFVQVELLKPRDVFGLANIRFDEFMENKSTNVSMVSRGAECIMVEKEFFIANATHEVKHAVMSLIRPYPDTKTLEGNLEDKANWDSYKDVIFKTSKDRVAERKLLLKKTFSVYTEPQKSYT